MLKVNELSFTYDGENFVLNNINLHIKQGEFVCILGENGCGKSTLAKQFNALLLPDRGSVVVNGMNTSDADVTFLVRKACGMVFQNPSDQLVASLVEDDVAFGPENLGVELPELRQRVTQALSQVGLAGFETQETHALSGGQAQRVAIAGVLAMQPKVLVLDEATAMLDPRGRAGLMKLCKKLHKQGFTIVMITHFMDEALEAQRVLVMQAGKIIIDGTPSEAFSNIAALKGLNIQQPFVCQVISNLADSGIKLNPCTSNAVLAKQLVSQARAQGAAGARANNLSEASKQNPAATSSSTTNCKKSSKDTPVLLEFKNVSYTYNPAMAKKLRKKQSASAALDIANSNAANANASTNEPQKWGNKPGNLWALSDISFKLNKGDFLGIVGHTGSGKSTLIQHMNGTIAPTSGTVLLCGANIHKNKRTKRSICSKVGVVFQYPEQQLFAESVYKDVAFGPKNLGFSESEIEHACKQALENVGLSFSEIAHKSPFELSGGQQRRVALAGVLAMKPEVLVLDEPVAGLDPANKRMLLHIISKLHEAGTTVVMVSHNMDDIANVCNRVLVINQGKLLHDTTPKILFTQHANELSSIGLGTTSAHALAVELSAQGFPINPASVLTQHDLCNSIKAVLLK